MIELSGHAGESVNLAKLLADRALFVSQIESTNMMRMVAPLGSLSPLHASGAQKALLSALNAQERNHLMDQLTYDALTNKTHQSKNSLTKEIERIIEEGRSYNREEHVEGMRCVATPVFIELGVPVCAFSVGGAGVRITEEVLIGHGDAVAQTANQATQLISGIPPSDWATYD